MDNSSREKTVVPKFSSFKPKKSTTPADTPTEKEVDPERREFKKDKDSRHHDSKKERDHERKRDTHRHSSRRQQSPQRKQWSSKSVDLPKREASKVQHNDDDDVIFVIDRKGDPLNLRYGRLSRSSVPKYSRRGAGSVLGLNPRKKIDRVQTDDKGIVIDNPFVFERPRRAGLGKQKQASSRPSRLIIPDDAQLDPRASFVPLGKKRKRESNHPPSDDEDFRFIETKTSKSGPNEDSGVQTASDSEEDLDYEAPGHRAVRERNASLILRSKTHPRDLTNWLDLIDHQDDFIHLGHSNPTGRLTANEKRSLAEIKLSIYKEALKIFRGDQESEAILLNGIVHHSKEILDDREYLQKLDELIRDFARNEMLLIERLSFMRNRYASFQFNQCKSAFIDCLLKISQLFQVEKNENRLEVLAQSHTYVLSNFFQFLTDSGYHELATALFQATLEFTVFRPVLPEGVGFLHSFKEFWESENLRIGEVKHGGWHKFVESAGEFEDTPDGLPFNLEEIQPSQHLFKDFVILERQTEHKLWRPGRALDDATEIDPYHGVFFDDIGPTLSSLIINNIAPGLLFKEFLHYFGLPPLESNKFSNDILETRFPHWISIGTGNTNLWAMVSPKASSPSKDILPPIFKKRIIETRILFGDAFQMPLLIDKDWLRNSLTAFASHYHQDHEVMEYLVAFILEHYGADDAAKEAKKYLKKTLSPRIYNAYAMIESRRERIESMNKVMSTAMNLKSAFPENTRQDVILLGHTWIWHHLNTNQPDEAIHLLLSMAEQRVEFPVLDDSRRLRLSGTPALKMERWLDDQLRPTLKNSTAAIFALFVELGMIFTYFSSGKDLVAVLQVISDRIALVEQQELRDPTLVERLHQSRTHFVLYHASHTKPYQPAKIQQVLWDSIRQFPTNTMFLEAYAKHEKSFGLHDHLRQVLTTEPIMKKQDTISNWLFSICHEAHRSPEAGGSSHRIRSAFERAVESQSGKQSSAIWTMYLQFEMFQGDTTKIKEIVYRGITLLPSVKHFVLLGIEALADTVSLEELTKLYKVLDDRELRTYISLQDILEAMANRRRSR